MSRTDERSRATAALLCAAAAAAALLPTTTGAQLAYCASDGQPRPRVLIERFISADCDSCWSDAATTRAGPRELAVDWIVPGGQGDDAPLSPAASTEALTRLAQLREAAPRESHTVREPLVASARTLRVSHGLPFNDYMGASIELRPAGHAPWQAWLLLVETLPAGTEGSPVERNLVRAAFQPPWDHHRSNAASSNGDVKKLVERRSMRIPEGADPERLRVVGWVEDARGRIRAISESRCRPEVGQR